MGQNQSKEEVIIAQAGGINNGVDASYSQTVKDYVQIALCGFAVLVLVAVLYKYCKKRLETKIRREICRSREEV